MYLTNLKILNFRKYGVKPDGSPGLSIDFKAGLNLIIGENDSGKTAIIDAIKLVLGTQSNDWFKLDESDFYVDQEGNRADLLRIECLFTGFKDHEAASFIEWLHFDKDSKQRFLKVSLEGHPGVNLHGKKVFYNIKIGLDEESVIPSAEAREKLKAIYLKPLRDTASELIPKRNSRLSQILSSHKVFENQENHPLLELMKTANEGIADYFNGEGKSILESINEYYLRRFSLKHNALTSKFCISDTELKRILEKLELKGLSDKFEHDSTLGLGSNNLLFIAAEMLLLEREDFPGLKLALVEEIEAHLHPQSQVNLIEFLEEESENIGFQIILTSHSPQIASKVDLSKIILCRNSNAYSLDYDKTKLSRSDYEFLRRFLDDTKSNLFFANGIIIVEGPSENLLLPALAEFIDRPLHKYGVSIVNVGSTALLRYAKILQRHGEDHMGIPVAVVTDRDLPPDKAKEFGYKKTESDYDNIEQIAEGKRSKYSNGDTQAFISSDWTMEYDIALSPLKHLLHIAVSIARNTNNLEKELNPREFMVLAESKLEEIGNQDGTDEDIAFTIFEPILEKKASKVVTAQILARILRHKRISEDPALRQKVKENDKLAYLTGAIYHVTSPPDDATGN